MNPTRLAALAGKARPDLRELVESGEAEEGRPLRNVVDKRLGYVGSAPHVGKSREGGIG